MPVSEQLAAGLNLPAGTAASVLEPLRNRLHLVCREGEYFDHAATGLFVPVLWYFVGWLIDKRETSRFRRHTRLRKILGLTGALIFSLGAGLVIASFFRSPFMEFLVMRVSVLAWMGFGIFAYLDHGWLGGNDTRATLPERASSIET
jgi:hypothetical protein